MKYIYLSYFTPASFQAKTKQNKIKAKAAKAISSDVKTSRSPDPKAFVFQPGDKVRYDTIRPAGKHLRLDLQPLNASIKMTPVIYITL